jgi:glutamate N-acetyltransferase/amino-acid N-acetyltransferase
MLVYFFIDAAWAAAILDPMLRRAVDVSFNMLSVDTDTSTSDTCAIMANGQAAPVDTAAFAAPLTAGCVHMTEMLTRDGEGATKLLRATVDGAMTADEARESARSLINPPLIKTMAYGSDLPPATSRRTRRTTRHNTDD